MKKAILTILLFSFLIFTNATSAKEDLLQFSYHDNSNKNWKFTYYDPWYICSAANNKGTFVAGDRYGSIAVTKDYKKWDIIDVADESINSIIYGKDKFVACGSNGAILYSVDGFKWEKAISGTKSFLSKIIWNGSFYLIVGEGNILKSTDGVHWEKTLNKNFKNFDTMAWSGSMFLASAYYVVEESDKNVMHSVLYSSNDGVKWRVIRDDSKYRYEDIVVSQGKFYILGQYYIPGTYRGDVYIDNGYKSRISIFNGKTIVDKELKDTLSGLYHANNKFLSFFYGKSIEDWHSILVSEDSINWSKVPLDIVKKHEKVRSEIGTGLPKLKCINYDGKKYSFVGSNGVIYISDDGYNWESVRPAISSILMDIIWDGKKFIITSGDGSFRYSYDGLKWIYSKDVSTYALNSISYNGSKYVALTTYDFLVSDDGINWEQRSTYLSQHLKKIIFDGNRFIVLSSSRKDGKTVISEITEDNNLNQLSANLLFNPRDMIWDGEKYIIVGEDMLQYSTDGKTWKSKKLSYNIEALTYGNGTYIAVGKPKSKEGGKVLTSKNGLDWTEIKPSNIMLVENSSSYNSATARWTGKEFIITNENSIFVSKNGFEWKDISPSKDKINIDFKTCISNDKMYIIPGVHCILRKAK